MKRNTKKNAKGIDKLSNTMKIALSQTKKDFLDEKNIPESKEGDEND
jgi:hypothetical protein